MDFELDSEWVVGNNTDNLNRALFGDTKANKSKQSRRRRKRIKIVSQQNTLQKSQQQISLPSDKSSSKKLISLKEHCSSVLSIPNVKKRKRKHDAFASESATNYLCNLKHHIAKCKGHNRHKHRKLDSSITDSPKSLIENSSKFTYESNLKKEKLRKKKKFNELKKEKLRKKKKFNDSSSENSTLKLAAREECDLKNKSLVIIGKPHRTSLRDNKQIINNTSSEKRRKGTVNSLNKSLNNTVSSDEQLSLATVPNSNEKCFQLEVKKLRHILKCTPSSYTANQKVKSKERKSGILILGKGKREAYSNIVRKQAADKLKSARFRFINEKLYTATGKESMHLFNLDPNAFEVYHDGFQSQVDKWPLNPVNVIINDICKKPKELTIADFGCGNAKIAQTFPDRKVYSFDLVSMNSFVTACDMAKVPLAKESVDIVVFCLALMGTNLNDYLCEAHRVLRKGGQLKIAEVISRMENPDTFIDNIKKFGFTLLEKNVTHKMFIFIDFKKTENFNKTQLPIIELKPCLYKKR